MTKTLTRPRHPIVQVLDNGPTPERAGKSVFTRGNPPRVLTTVQSLLNAGDITQDDANAGERWYRDYVFGKFGYVEYAPDYVKDATIKHDPVSWQVVRAKAWGRVLDVKRAYGVGAELRLRMMLVDEMSFTKMAKEFFPHMSLPTARTKISGQSAMLLEQLAAFYRNKDGVRCAAKQELLVPCAQV